jgi:PAS domain S-box-containing protein
MSRPDQQTRAVLEFPEHGAPSNPDAASRNAVIDRALRIRDEQISLATQTANLGFWSRDYEREDFWASDNWRTLFGFTGTEILTIDKFLERLHPHDRETTLQALANAYQTDGSYSTEHRVVLPDGRVRWFACQGRLEFKEDNQPLRLQGISLDITQRKLAEQEAQTHRNEAAHLLRVASLGELSSALTHELKQPLTAIMSNVQAAQRLLACDELDLPQVREILADILADNQRAAQIIDRSHGFIKRRDLQPQPLEANQLIRDVLQIMNHELISRSVQVVTDFTATALMIQGERVQLQQVLLNLILNAIDSMSHSAKGDRTLTLRSRRSAGDLIQISVADTGSGVPPGHEETIFESYYTTKPEGLGLGLSLSRSIVAAHGGLKVPAVRSCIAPFPNSPQCAQHPSRETSGNSDERDAPEKAASRWVRQYGGGGTLGRPLQQHSPVPSGPGQRPVAKPPQARFFPPSPALLGTRPNIERRPSGCTAVVVPMNDRDLAPDTQHSVSLLE